MYFISLVSCDVFGKPNKTRGIFDILTAWFEFHWTKTDVQFLDAQYLKKYYTEHPRKGQVKDPNVYQVSEYFMADHPDSHFIFDEVPILDSGKIPIHNNK